MSQSDQNLPPDRQPPDADRRNAEELVSPNPVSLEKLPLQLNYSQSNSSPGGKIAMFIAGLAVGLLASAAAGVATILGVLGNSRPFGIFIAFAAIGVLLLLVTLAWRELRRAPLWRPFGQGLLVSLPVAILLAAACFGIVG